MENSDRESVSGESDRPIRVGIIGLGGFAGSHHKTLLVLEGMGESVLICTCDPKPDLFTDRMEEWEFKKRKVAVYDHYLKMLDAHDKELDVVVIPTPIPLHFEMQRECVRRGLKVYLEKPPTLDYRELEAMIEGESKSPRKTQVGFNFIVQKERQALKQRLLDGEFGALQEIRLLGLWPRGRFYFKRSNWAGRLKMGDQLVLDSVIGNAMSHFVHNCLFWGGSRGVSDWAPIASLQAKVYRGHAIEGGDTFFIKATAENGVCFRLALSHAYTGPPSQNEFVYTENACIESNARREFEIKWKGGRCETIEHRGPELMVENHIALYNHCRDANSRPTTTLEDCRPIVHVNDLAYISSGDIFQCPVQESTDDSGREWLNIVGVADAAREFLDSGTFPTSDKYPWANDDEPQLVSPADLGKLPSTIEHILENSKNGS